MEKKIHHILLVEDDEAHAELAREALESDGGRFSVTVARSLEEARAALAESHVDLAIVDWSLPDGKGSELLPGSLDAAALPIIIMTARGDERLAVELMKAGALDYVVKSAETLSDMRHTAERSLREWDYITDRKRMAEQRRITQYAIDHISESAQLVKRDGRFAYVNDALCQSLGYSREEVLSMGVQDIDPGFPPETWEGLWRDLKEQGSVTFESQHRTKDGRVFPVEIRANYVEFEGQEYHFTFARDITERKRADEALKESEERFRALFHNAPLSYQSLQADGNFLEVNDTWCEMLGYRREEVIGKNFADFLAPGFVEHFLYNFPCFKRDGEIHGVEFEMVRKDSRHINVVFEGRISHNPDGTFRRTHCILQDVTERKRAEEKERNFEAQMQQTQKLESLGVMAGGIAHDFNNILFAILGNADIALDEMPPEAVGRDRLQEIRTAARRASELTDQMLAYSGRGALAIEKIDLSGLVQEMAHLLEVSHTKKTVVKYRFEKNLSAIEGDPSQLRQVVMNLITNASEAVGEEGGIITVHTGVTEATPEYLATTYAHDELPGGRYVYLEVADTGCGMDEETQRRIFEPFFTTKFTGRGLGMAAVLGIVRAHKGAIDIRSEVDRGTTVKVLFPALDEPAIPPSQEAPREEEWTAHGTVLAVDDEPQIRNLTKIVLERKGFTVLTAEDGRQATDVFQKHKDDIVCVLLDLTMPHMGGEETFVELHQIRDDVPVILVSGYSEEELQGRVEDLGFAGFLKKPVGSKDLLETVRSVLKLTKRT